MNHPALRQSSRNDEECIILLIPNPKQDLSEEGACAFCLYHANLIDGKAITASSRTTTFLRICARHPLRMRGVRPMRPFEIYSSTHAFLLWGGPNTAPWKDAEKFGTADYPTFSKALFSLASASSLTELMKSKKKLDVGLSWDSDNDSWRSNTVQVGLNQDFFSVRLWSLDSLSDGPKHSAIHIVIYYIQYREDREIV
jgi:hypothetical protein